MYVRVLDRQLLQRLMSPSPKLQVMFASAFHSCQHGLTKCGTFSSFRWLSPDIYRINILRNPKEVDVNLGRSAKPK